ncbi:serpin-ZX-like [Rutidosis leptorrhynchoides]|uniref:serpin-ZX-like n=1 Tax=Rutidosis leptorrhynchoides TaxID=125765 RepID=UPI003A98CEED
MVIRSGSNSHTLKRNIGFLFVSLCIFYSIYVAFLIHTPTTLNDLEFSTTHNHLFRLLTNQHNKKHVTTSNIVFSPLSIDTVLRPVAVGSSGETLKQFLSYLKAQSIDEINFRSLRVSSVLGDGSPFGGPRLSYANGVWVDQTISFHPYFEHAVKILHNATCMQGDFKNKPAEVADEVNLWVEKQTSGMIKDILPADAVSTETALMLANALYFKGVWKEKFDRSMTKLHDFHRLDGTTVQVPYMTTNSKQILCQYDGFKVLGLPYEQGEDKRHFTMYFYLPDKSDDLQNLVEKIDSKADFFKSYIPSKKVEVEEVMIPKFKISYGFEASNMLKELGLVLPFIPGGLTNMVNSSSRGKDLYISSIHHKSFVEVNEEGTEAAAATTVSIVNSLKMEFIASHPFLIVIREDMSATVLFIGQVVDPSVS